MAFTSADLIAIQRAIAKGELSVEFSDRRVQYRSMAELLQAEAHITGALQTVNRPRQTKLYADKGF